VVKLSVFDHFMSYFEVIHFGWPIILGYILNQLKI